MIGALKVPTWFPLRPSRVPAAHKLWHRDILYDTIAPFQLAVQTILTKTAADNSAF